MSDQFEWKDEYSVGVYEIDSQHMFLFDLCNSLTNIPLEYSPSVVLQIFSYVNKHFRAEENHMKEIGFPELEEHKVQHNQIISKFNATIENKIKTEEEYEQLKTFLYSWIVHHVIVEDKKYFDYSKTQQG